MINDQLLKVLCCPLDHSLLTLAEPSFIERINREIANKQLSNKSGQVLEKQLDSGLLRAAGDLLYPVVDGIPVLLPDEAIVLSQLKKG